MWFRYMLVFESGMSMMSASSFNKPRFALDAAIDRALARAGEGDVVVRISVYESKA